MRRKVHYMYLALGLSLMPTANLNAGEIMATAMGGIFNVPVTSMKEMRTARVIMQQYDFSCGAAAVATLLSFHYGKPTGEYEVFKSMFDKGDQDVIRDRGFSMLDMKGYLESQGYRADGFRLDLDRVRKIGVPAITLIDMNGYKHFVVIKGIDDENVMVGDPAFGASVMSRERFESMWSGTVLAIRDKPYEAREQFNLAMDWNVRPKAPVGSGVARGSVSAFTRYLPTPRGF